MNFTFEPKTEEELAEGNLLPEGEYEFEIMGALMRKSQAGNSMLEIDILLEGKEKGNLLINDFLVSMPKMIWKIKHFCECIGLREEYKKGDINPSALPGLKGKAQVTIEKQNKFPPRNKIKDYIVEEKEERYFHIDKGINKKIDTVEEADEGLSLGEKYGLAF